MMKKILPMMIGAALAGGMSTASADVQVFGHIDESLVHWNVDLSGGEVFDGSPVDAWAESWDDTNLVCTTCSIGFKGSEDLGNGLKAIFSLDFQYDINFRNSTSLKDRDQWIGLAGGFGKVRVGTISTGYKSHGSMIDPVYRTVVQARDVGLQSSLHSNAGEEGQGRAENTFRWDSPDFNGLKIVAHYTLDSDEFDGYDGEREDNNPYGIGASYENGGILVFGDYLTNDGDGNPITQNDLTAWKLGGKFSMDNFAVFGQYEDIQNDAAYLHDDVTLNLGMLGMLTGLSQDDLRAGIGNDLGIDSNNDPYDNETTVWHIGGTFTMGSNTLYAAYGQSSADLSAAAYGFPYSATVDTDSWTIAGIHSFSKNTLAYLGYTNVSVSADAVFDVLDRWNEDVDVDAFALGIKHKF